jgi:hypothetical protein
MFYRHLGYFITNWWISCSFGTFFRFRYREPRKIWQPCFVGNRNFPLCERLQDLDGEKRSVKGISAQLSRTWILNRLLRTGGPLQRFEGGKKEFPLKNWTNEIFSTERGLYSETSSQSYDFWVYSYNANGRLVRFENKNIFFNFEKRSSLLLTTLAM